jgi:FixJ family two-component response regulator
MLGPLSIREAQVAILRARGLTCRQIALRLNLGLNTVLHNLRSRVKKKLGTFVPAALRAHPDVQQAAIELMSGSLLDKLKRHAAELRRTSQGGLR